MTVEEEQRYKWLISKTMRRVTTAAEDTELNKLGKLKVDMLARGYAWDYPTIK